MAKEKKGPGGQPTKYDPKYCELLIQFARDESLSYQCFPAYLLEKTGVYVCIDTLYEWERVHPQYSDAKKLFLEICRRYWEGLGKDAAASKAPGAFNATAWIFSMKNRFNWRDKTEISGSGEHGEIQIETKRDKLKEVLTKPELLDAAIQIAEIFSKK